MKYAVVDLESTGPRLDDGDRIIQIGAVIVEDRQIIGQHQMLINPLRPLPVDIKQLTGIETDDLLKAPTFDSVAELWRQRLEGCVFVAHNLHHDLTFLKAHFKQAGITFNPSAIDSVKLAKILLPQSQGFNLLDISQELGLPFDQAHQALEDARITCQMMDYLADVYQSLPEVNQRQVVRFAEYLDNQEVEFFKNPQSFCLASPLIQPDQTQVKLFCENKVTPIMTAQLEWLSQVLGESSHLLIEGQNRPVDSELLKNWLVNNFESLTGPIWLSLSNTAAIQEWIEYLQIKDINFSILLAPSAYLHLGDFESYLKQIDLACLNQQELVVLAAVFVWLSQTQTGLLLELNQELSIQDQVDRFFKGRKTSQQSNYFYQEALNSIKSHSIILSHPLFLMDLQESPAKVRVQGLHSQALLIVDDLSLFDRQIRARQSLGINYSRWLVKCQQILDRLYHLNRNEGQIQLGLSVFEKVKDQLLDILDWIEQVFRQDLQWVDRTIHRQQLLSNEDQAFFVEMNQKLFETLTFELALFKTFDKEEALFSKKIGQFRYQAGILKQLVSNLTQGLGYSLIGAQQMQEHFFQFVWIWKPLQSQTYCQNLLESFKQVLLLSPGGANYKQAVGSSKRLGLETYRYLIMPQSHGGIQGYLPLELIASHPGSDIWVQKQAQLLGQELWDLIQQQSLPALILLVVNNRQQAIDTYRQIKEKLKDQTALRIQSQHVSGSLNRIRRSVLEAEAAIVIVQWQSLLNEHWHLSKGPVRLYWLRLPFRSLEDPLIQALARSVDLEKELVFDQLLLPEMVKDFSIAIDYLDRHFPITEWYFLDERIFTKYYAKEIRQRLEPLIEFNIQ